MDQSYIRELIEREHDNVAGIIIVKDNTYLYESYFNGFNQDDTIHIASVTKSLMSILVGIAIDKGAIRDVEQSVLDFFPNYKLKRGEKTLQNIKLKHLLTMTAPYKCKFEPHTKIYSSDNWGNSILDLLGGKGNIGDFRYTTVCIHILSNILTNATGSSVVDFAETYLFKPLGINRPKNIRLRNREEHFSFIKGKHVSGWVVDPTGVNSAGWGLTLTTKDIAKIGLLYLNMGSYKGEKLVSKEWVEESTRKQSQWGGRSYGYLWWVVEDQSNCYAAIGDGGNIIYVCPKKNIVIGMTSSFKPRADNRLELIKDHLIPMIEKSLVS